MRGNPNSDSFSAGESLGKWRIVGLLGKGGMAEVYEVEDARLGAHYALKLFTYDRGTGDAVRERFFAEGRLLAKLDHPRLVRVYDVAEDEVTGRPYFVMDLVLDPEGRPRTLADAGAAGADEEQIAVWYEDLRDGLAYIHGKGILHRDLKLQNVLIGADGHAVLSDFGVAKIFNRELREQVGLTAEMTLVAARAGKQTVMGSIGYLAPEVEMGVAASKESDWYALGVLVFHLLTGVWCDARTDVVGDLETYDPLWKEILPKLLHANPSGRACPSWTELTRKRNEETAFAAEQAVDELGRKRNEAVRGRRNAWIAAVMAATCAAVLACFVQRTVVLSPLSPDFDEICVLPDDYAEDGPDQTQFELARVDAWVLTERIFADMRTGRLPTPRAANKIQVLARRAAKEKLDFTRLLPGYEPMGDPRALSTLLFTTYTNLVSFSRF